MPIDLGEGGVKVHHPLAKYAAASGLILAGAVLSTYMYAGSQPGNLIWKFVVAVVFGVFAYVWLVKPNLGRLAALRSTSEIELGQHTHST